MHHTPVGLFYTKSARDAFQRHLTRCTISHFIQLDRALKQEEKAAKIRCWFDLPLSQFLYDPYTKGSLLVTSVLANQVWFANLMTPLCVSSSKKAQWIAVYIGNYSMMEQMCSRSNFCIQGVLIFLCECRWICQQKSLKSRSSVDTLKDLRAVFLRKCEVATAMKLSRSYKERWHCKT